MYQPSLFWRRSLKTVAAPLARGWTVAKNTLASSADGNAQIVILAYHRVVSRVVEAEQDSIYGLVISTESFARHLEIVRAQYEVLTMDEAVLALRGERRLTRTAAVITFDDGYRDVYENAWPVLQRMGLPAVVYVPTAFIGTNQIFDHDRLYWLIWQARSNSIDLRKPLEDAGLAPQQAAWICTSRQLARVADVLNYRPLEHRQKIIERLETELQDMITPYPASYELMTWEMVREMNAGGISFGAHSDRHLILTLEAEATVEQEIRRSKQTLETQLHQHIHHFAYPNGYFTPAIKTRLAQAGFASSVTTQTTVARRGDDLLALGRISLCEESTRGITGGYSAAVAHLRLAA